MFLFAYTNIILSSPTHFFRTFFFFAQIVTLILCVLFILLYCIPIHLVIVAWLRDYFLEQQYSIRDYTTKD